MKSLNFKSNHLMFRVHGGQYSKTIGLVCISYTTFVSNFCTRILIMLFYQFLVYENYSINVLTQINILDTFKMYIVKEKYYHYNYETKT